MTTNETTRRKNVQDAIDRVLFKINEIEAIVAEFDGQNELLHTKLNEYIEELGKLDSVKDDMIVAGQPVDLAVELLRAVDEGTNPDTFTVQLFRDSLAQNQASKGKVEAFKLLQQQVAQQLQQAFPTQVADYQQLRQPPAAAPSSATDPAAAAQAADPAAAAPAADPAATAPAAAAPAAQPAASQPPAAP